MSEIEKLKKQFQKISGDRKGPLQAGAEIAINIKNGEIKIEIVSIIEDLKTDTEYYLKEAKKEKDPINKKRNIRAAVLTFNAYVEATINQLYSAILYGVKLFIPGFFIANSVGGNSLQTDFIVPFFFFIIGTTIYKLKKEEV